MGPVEPEIWNRKESILKNAKSIPKIANITADIGAKSANRGSTMTDTQMDVIMILLCFKLMLLIFAALGKSNHTIDHYA